MEPKTEKTLHDKILESVFYRKPASLRDWEAFLREAACTTLLPGYTANRFQRNIGIPEKDRVKFLDYWLHEAFKISFWGTAFYNTYLQYFN
ncbi:MAG: hypothetical protein ACW963_04805 [Candidatus Sifarchaeia archaeon]|jgi:hypothetical protein